MLKMLELEKALAKIKIREALGRDLVHPQMIKYLAEEEKWVLAIVNVTWKKKEGLGKQFKII